MKIFVVGAGATGSVLINALVKEKGVSQILCLSRNRRAAEEFVRPTAKVKILSGDVKNIRRISLLAKGSKVVVNAASPWLNIEVMKLALSVGAHYQDLEAYLGFDNGISRQPYAIEHLAFEKEFKGRGLVALFDAGAAPGLTNLLVASAADRLGSLGTVKIRLIEDLKSSILISGWSPQAALDEVYSRPVKYENGKYRLISRFSDSEEFYFPKPFGKRITYSIMNNEAFTLPKYLKVKNAEVRSAGSDDEVARLMVGLGLLDKKPVHIHGAVVTPLEFLMKILPSPPTPKELNHLLSKGLIKDAAFAAHLEITPADGRGKKFSQWVVFASQRNLYKRKIYNTYIAYPAGLCAAAFTLEFPYIKTPGVVPPEGLLRYNRENILKRIKKFGIKIRGRT